MNTPQNMPKRGLALAKYSSASRTTTKRASSGTGSRTSATQRTLAWNSQSGLSRVCDMPDDHLLNAHSYLATQLLVNQVMHGVMSTSLFTLQYFEAELSDRGLAYTKFTAHLEDSPYG